MLKHLNRESLAKDLLTSIVVFLVALPLCMGIAIASGAPPTMGIISGIIGGLVVGSIAGCPLQVSGPAAGLAVMYTSSFRLTESECWGQSYYWPEQSSLWQGCAG